MYHKIIESLSLIQTHFLPLAAIVLTVRIPLNLLLQYLYYSFILDDQAFFGAAILTGLIDPIFIAAIVYFLYTIKEGDAITYREAMVAGVKNWGRLLIAEVEAGLMVFGGLLLLLIPGLVLIVRYTLLAPVVVIEGRMGALARCRTLAKGQMWELFALFMIGILLSEVLAFGSQLLAITWTPLNQYWIMAGFDSLVDIVYGLTIVVFFVYYWHARSEEETDDSDQENTL